MFQEWRVVISRAYASHAARGKLLQTEPWRNAPAAEVDSILQSKEGRHAIFVLLGEPQTAKLATKIATVIHASAKQEHSKTERSSIAENVPGDRLVCRARRAVFYVHMADIQRLAKVRRHCETAAPNAVWADMRRSKGQRQGVAFVQLGNMHRMRPW